MCRFDHMENYQGDLTDILRGTAGSDASAPPAWRFPSAGPINFMTSGVDVVESSFGDPFSVMSDPLLLEHDASSAAYFIAPPAGPVAPVVDDSFCGESGTSSNMSVLGHYKIFEDDTKGSPPCNILSRIQISSSGKQMGCDSPAMVSPRGVKPPPAMVAGDVINVSSSKGCLTDGAGPVQISSPRNLGIKRRKNQAKKVVCIPAPAAANSRSSGEVVPSDLWAWRKYGQKPIKGSPYPRGYYRCSSSKGCSARKQVERSRTDPNMLVITYTSEHNHPWPTQRNALAGSTRSQPSTKGSSSSKSNKDEAALKESSSDGADMSPTVAGTSVKEEADDAQNKEMELEGAELLGGEGFNGYRPEMISAEEISSHQPHDDLFAGLDEIEADPLNLLFSGDDESSTRQKGVVDHFSIFDWSGEIKRSL